MDNDSVLGILFVLIAFLFLLGMMALTVWIWWRIVSRTGMSGWLSLLVIVPLANIVLMLILAFGEWPVHRELADLRRRLAAG